MEILTLTPCHYIGYGFKNEVILDKIHVLAYKTWAPVTPCSKLRGLHSTTHEG